MADWLIDSQGAFEGLDVDIEAGGGHLFNRGVFYVKGDTSFREGFSGADVSGSDIHTLKRSTVSTVPSLVGREMLYSWRCCVFRGAVICPQVSLHVSFSGAG